MKARKVISLKALPARIPVIPTCVAWLMLDRLDAPGWAWGVVMTFIGIVWIGSIAAIWINEYVDPFEEVETGPKMSRWQKRMEEIRQQQAERK
jgi:hypothetical protein